MRTLAVVLLLALPTAFAAPVPKELRKASIVGMWEVVVAATEGGELSEYKGKRWKFGRDGDLANPAYPSGRYSRHPDGLDIWFDPRLANPSRALVECTGETLKLAFAKDRVSRATDFDPANNNVVYTFKRVKE